MYKGWLLGLIALSVSSHAALKCPEALNLAHYGFTLSHGSNKVEVFGSMEDGQGHIWYYKGSFGSMKQIDVQALHKKMHDELKGVQFLYHTQDGARTVCHYQTPQGRSIKLSSLS